MGYYLHQTLDGVAIDHLGDVNSPKLQWSLCPPVVCVARSDNESHISEEGLPKQSLLLTSNSPSPSSLSLPSVLWS